MSGEIDIYEMAMKAEARLRDSRIERVRLQNEGNAPSNFQANIWAPFLALSSLTRSHLRLLQHGEPSLESAGEDVTPAPIASGDAVS